MSPASGNSDSYTTTPLFTPAIPQYQTYVSPQSLSGNTDYSQPPYQSSFTSELPNDAKLLANINPSDPLAGAFFGMPDYTGGDIFDFSQFSSAPDDLSATKQLDTYGAQSSTDYFHSLQQPQSKFLHMPGEDTRIGTPGGGEGDAWDNWIDENEWNFDADNRWVKSEHN